MEYSNFSQVFSIVHGGLQRSRDPRERTPLKTPFSRLRQQQQQQQKSMESLESICESRSHLNETPLLSKRIVEDGGGGGLEVVDRTPLHRQRPGVDLREFNVRRLERTGSMNFPNSRSIREVLEAEVGFSKRTLKVSLKDRRWVNF